MNIKDLFHPKNPYHWYGLIIIILAILLGGAIGAIIGIIAGISVIQLGKNKKLSNIKKIIFTILITFGAFILYFILLILFF